MTVDTGDHVYLKIRVGEIEQNKPWRIGLLHLDATGRVVDTIPPPTFPDASMSQGGRFIPSKLWSFGPHRAFLVGVNDRYVFEIRPQSGRTVVVERAWKLLRLHPAEHAEWEAVRDWVIARSAASRPPPIPQTKPAYAGFGFGRDGRIWVRRHVNAVKDRTFVADQKPDRPPPITWREPPVWDVFEEDGTYLGEVHAPLRTTLMVIGRDRVWGVRLGEQGEACVVRFRLVRADSGRS